MNRQHRRQSQRQGQEAAGDGGNDALGDDAEALVGAALSAAEVESGSGGAEDTAAPRARTNRGPTTAPAHHRVAPRQFLHEVNVELRKVAWPTRAETINYSTVVFITLAILMAMIFFLDLAFTHLAGFLFNP